MSRLHGSARLPAPKGPAAGFDRLPQDGHMTAIALWPESPFVFIVFPVATRTGAADSNLLPHRLGVTGIAIHGRVGAVQYETGASIVIELP